MIIRIKRLTINCREAVEELRFTDVSYFHGPVGTGKSTIARLIDYCLGARGLTMTPALQAEFVGASLELTAGVHPVHIARERNSGQVLATWGEIGNQQQVAIPVKQSGGEVMPDTGVEVLSDLIFWLCGLKPPRVRRSRQRSDSDLERLSIRDLLWYCYLDQDSMDSSFYHLDRDSDHFRRLKSKNVLRYLLGYHQDRVAELEDERDELRSARIGNDNAIRLLRETLEEVGFSKESEIDSAIDESAAKLDQVNASISEVRKRLQGQVTHAADELRKNAKEIFHEIEAVEQATSEVTTSKNNNERYLNELYTLSTKFQRTGSARAVLSKVDFQSCPSCAQPLPGRESLVCPVCAQPELTSEDVSNRVAEMGQDLRSRIGELKEVIESQIQQLQNMSRRLSTLNDDKSYLDQELSRVSEQYDSAYLSEALQFERNRADLDQEIRYLKKLRALPAKLESMLSKADGLASDEARVTRELAEARKRAEKDTQNLQRLSVLFLDCAVRAALPGISVDDEVRISHENFLPEIYHSKSGDTAVTSFQTMGSGGKKTTFKACFALAVHRLAREIDANLPTVLIIDSPMKNISERRNRNMFEGFHKLAYELAESELAGTQIIMMDKEYCPPQPTQSLDIAERYMTLDNPSHPPLISYYRG